MAVGGLSSLNGGIAVDTDNFTVSGTTGATVIQSTLEVTGTANLDGGIAVDTSNFTVSGTTGAVLAAGLASLNGGIAVDTSNFTVSGTTGAVATASKVTVGTFLITSEAAVIPVTAALAIVPLGSFQPISSTTAITDATLSTVGAVAGQLLTLVNQNASDAITITEGSTAKTASTSVALGSYDSIMLIFDGTYWVETGASDN
jgi:hypothetical protein